ncbi:hypothetical protein KSP40_PGU020804 [Platanthera guangdongensis]|uniref:Uncharacterized protein n=1 Tax=Platanthera guangdongensis TaxID=2320717 RepID=A0ABR2LWA3_9ASPA
MQNPVLHQESSDLIKEPTEITISIDSSNSHQISDAGVIKKNDRPNKKEAKTTNSMNHEKEITEKQNVNPTGSDVRVRQLKDQLIQARVYQSLSSTRSNPHFIRELRFRIREV